MICPHCGNRKGLGVTLVRDHYICNDKECRLENGSRSQFYLVEDNEVKFPYNQIFNERFKREFYRKPYLTLKKLK